MADPHTTVDIAALSAPERLLLAQHLLDSVVAEAIPLSPEQMEAVHKRAAAIDDGTEQCESWHALRLRLLPHS